ncbi:hypothetical protein D3C83_199930 [compost metagenome]
MAVVDRHRAHRRVRENEADRREPGQVQLVHDRHEIVAVGAEAVHPDDGGFGVLAGFELDRFQ